MRAWGLGLVAILTAACGGDDAGPGGGGAGGSGTGGAGGSVTFEAGVGTWACSPGEHADDDGACIAPGVPPGACADGFIAEDSGCTPVLPASCPAGLMAVPGDSDCREVAPCGPGKWDGIPLEPNAVFVDATYPGNDSDGTQAKPYTSLLVANAQAPSGALVAIAPGAYDTGSGGLNVNKPLRFWGKCPAEVTISGSANATIQFDGGSASELHQVSVTGSFAVAVSPASDVLLDRIHVPNATLAPVLVQNPAQHGITSATVRDSLLVGGGAGVVGIDADVTIEGTMIRGQSDAIPELPGHAVQLTLGDPAGLGELVVRDSVLEQFQLRAVAAAGANVTLDGVVLRHGGDGDTAIVDVVSHPVTGASVEATLTRSVIHDVVGAAIDVVDGDLIVDALTVRDVTATNVSFFGGMFVAAIGATSTPVARIEHSTFERLDGWGFGDASVDLTVRGVLVRDIRLVEGFSWGASLGTAEAAGQVPRIEIEGLRIEQSGALGLQIVSGDVDVTSLHVADLPGVAGISQSGRGVSVSQLEGHALGSTFTLRDSLVERTGSVGINLSRVQSATLSNSLVADTQGDADGTWGQGINVQLSAGSPVAFERVSVRGAAQSGIAILSSEVALTGVEVDATRETAEGLFGDGVTTMTLADGGAPALVTARDVVVNGSARASLALFGASADLGNVELRCGAFPINGELWGDQPFAIQDGGGVSCGCEADELCKTTSAQLMPPSPLQDDPASL